MVASKEANVVAFRGVLDDLGWPVAESFLFGVDQEVGGSL